MPDGSDYYLLPFRFTRLNSGRILLSNDAGEWKIISQETLSRLVEGRLIPDDPDPDADSLEAKHFFYRSHRSTAVRLSAAKLRTRKAFLRGGPALHIFVVSLRCDHGCAYCQVSRQTVGTTAFDMTEATARAAVERVFESPSRNLTIEFQGGEPLLAFPTIRFITELVLEKNESAGRNITFTITSTLHHLTDEILDFFKTHDFQVSTSLDGPTDIHNANRPTGGDGSYIRTINGLEYARES